MKKFISACLATVLLTGGLALTSAPAFADDSGSPGPQTEQVAEQAAPDGAADAAGDAAASESAPADDSAAATGSDAAEEPAAQVSEQPADAVAQEPAEQSSDKSSADSATASTSTVAPKGAGHHPPKPEKPADIVTYGEWKSVGVDCAKGVEKFERTVTTQTWTWDKKKGWVKGEITETKECKECEVKPGQCTPETKTKVEYTEWEKVGDPDCVNGIQLYERTKTTYFYEKQGKKWILVDEKTETETKECEVKPEQCTPDPVVTTGEWEVTSVDCEAKTQTLTRTITTTPWKWSEHTSEWVPDTENATTETETETKAATPEQCPAVEVIPVAPSVTAAAAVCQDGAPLRSGGSITLPAIENATWEGYEPGTLTDVDPGDYTFQLVANEGYVIADANGFSGGAITVTVADATDPDCTVPAPPTEPGTSVPPAPKPAAAPAAKLAVTGGEVAPWLLPAGGLALLAGLVMTIRSARASRR